MRGVDHDGRAKFAADGARRRLGRIGRSQHIADFGDRIHAFIDQCDALFRAGLFQSSRGNSDDAWPDMKRMIFSN